MKGCTATGRDVIVIHAGMNKTGSTSIQRTFVRLDGDRVECPVGKPQPLQFKRILGRRRSGRTLHPLLISDEGFSMLPGRRVEALFNALRNCPEDIRVIAYVRPPRSFMSSQFQQQCKKRFINLNGHALDAHWPLYRRRFERLDTLFGRENVTPKPFQRERLEGGDVVLDFAREIGVALEPGEVIRVNESMSLKVVALLYVFWRFGQQLDLLEKYHVRRFVGCVSGLESRVRTAETGLWQHLHPCPESSRRFILADTLTDPIVGG